MKTYFFIFISFFILTGCQKKVEELDKEECKKAGHIYTEKKSFNYYLGKEEISGLCVERKK